MNNTVRAATTARRLLLIVESGELDRRPDVAQTAAWLYRTVDELDKLRTERDPVRCLDRLDELIAELSPTNHQEK